MLGQGWMTGHQKISDVIKKQACSTWCQTSERNASSYSAGMCQANIVMPISTSANTGCVTVLPTRLATDQFKNGPANSRAAKTGRPRTRGTSGAPSRIKGGAIIISTMCWSM